MSQRRAEIRDTVGRDSILSGRRGIVDGMANPPQDTSPQPHWKHTATRCAVEGCDRTRVKGWSTCALIAHKPLGKQLAGAGRIDKLNFNP